MATSKDVAKLAAVSHTTVSRAFRPNSSIRGETYERIMRAARQLNYSPNPIASSLRSQKSHTVGLVLSHPNVKLFIDLAQALGEELRRSHYRMLIAFCDSDAEQQQAAMKAMQTARVDSIVYMPAFQPATEEQSAWMCQSGIQFLQIICNVYSEQSSFVFEDVAGTLLGMRYLFNHGHRRVLMLGGVNRVEGYTSAYRELGVPPPIPYTSIEDLTSDECRAAIRELLLKYQPTAVFSISERVSSLTYGVLSNLRLRIPEDVSLLTFDDTSWGESMQISAIGHPIQGMARAIVHQIVSFAADDSQAQLPCSTTFMPFLVERQSVTQPAGGA